LGKRPGDALRLPAKGPDYDNFTLMNRL